ncbi:hypothetical protein BAE44_0006179, partial [Dichanthelium oligosanthes]
LAVLAVLATLPLGKGHTASLAQLVGRRERGGRRESGGRRGHEREGVPCCDKCGLCLLMYPPQCNCMDFSERGCHPACRNCVRYIADGGIRDEPPVYRCADLPTSARAAARLQLLPRNLECGHLNAGSC